MCFKCVFGVFLVCFGCVWSCFGDFTLNSIFADNAPSAFALVEALRAEISGGTVAKLTSKLTDLTSLTVVEQCHDGSFEVVRSF